MHNYIYYIILSFISIKYICAFLWNKEEMFDVQKARNGKL